MNTFDSYKEQGNKFYKKCSDSLPSPLWKDNLNSAIVNYETATKLARSDDQRSSIMKNLGMAHVKHFDIATTKEERIFYTLEAIKKFEEALKYAGDKSDEWKNFIEVYSKDRFSSFWGQPRRYGEPSQ